MTDSKELPGFTRTGQILLGSSWPELVKGAERNIIIQEMESRFGIPISTFSEYLIFKRKKGWWILRNSMWIKEASSLKISVAGFKAFQRVGRYIKPTTRFIQLFGHLATKSIAVVDEQQLAQLASGVRLALDLNIEDGYVILKLPAGQIVGTGLWTRGLLQSQLPKKEVRWKYEGRIISG